MDKKGLLKSFMDSMGTALGTLLDKIDGVQAEPGADGIEAAKAALAAEHTQALETLKAEHTAALKALQDQIEELKKATPGSARQEVTDPAGVQKVGGAFCGYTDAA